MELTEIRNIIMTKTYNYNVDEVDDAINFIQRSYIQPIARLNKIVEYVVGNFKSVKLSDIANNIYKINHAFIGKLSIPLLNINNVMDYGIRRSGDTVHFQNISIGSKIDIHYQTKLKELSTNNPTPEIGDEWHDLYWLGGIAILDMENYPVFLDRLESFKKEMAKKDRPDGWMATVRSWC